MIAPLRGRFVRDVAQTTGSQAVQGALTMVAGILVARYLGPSARGTLAVLFALSSMSILLASFGVNSSAVYFLGRFKSERASIVSNVVLVGFVGGVATGAGLVAAVAIFQDQLLHGIAFGIFLGYVLAVPCAYFNSAARNLLLGAGRVDAYNAPALIEGGGLFVGTALAIAVLGDQLLPLVILRVIVEAAIVVFLFLFVRRVFGLQFAFSLHLLRRQVTYGLRNYSASLLWLFLLQSDLILCNYFLGSGPTGIYAVALSLAVPITLLAGVVGALTFQRASSTENRSERVANTNRTIRVLCPIMIGASIVGGASAPWLIPLLFGSQFRGAILALLLLLPGLIALSIELVPMNFLAAEGSPPIVYLAPLAGFLVNLGANLIVIPRWGIDGAAVTSSVGYVIVLVLVMAYYLRSTGSTLRDVFGFCRSDLRVLLGQTDARFAAHAKAQA